MSWSIGAIADWAMVIGYAINGVTKLQLHTMGINKLFVCCYLNVHISSMYIHKILMNRTWCNLTVALHGVTFHTIVYMVLLNFCSICSYNRYYTTLWFCAVALCVHTIGIILPCVAVALPYVHKLQVVLL